MDSGPPRLAPSDIAGDVPERRRDEGGIVAALLEANLPVTPAGAAERPVAAALARVRADVHHPAVCAEALGRAAELLDGSAPRPSPADDAARYLRDAARILRREHALFER